MALVLAGAGIGFLACYLADVDFITEIVAEEADQLAGGRVQQLSALVAKCGARHEDRAGRG